MGFWSLFLVASTPSVQVLLIGFIGAYLASGYSNILLASTRRDINKVVYAVFTPSLMFASLAKTVTLQDIISWWFMPVNIGIIFLIGSVLGWIAVKILRPPRHLEGLVIASCSAGNLGNLLLIIIPAVCDEDGNPFGDHESCRMRGLSYVSFSMALGGLYIWTYTYGLMRRAGKIHHRIQASGNEASETNSKISVISHEREKLVGKEVQEVSVDQKSELPTTVMQAAEVAGNQIEIPLLSSEYLNASCSNFWEKLKRNLHQIVEELLAPPMLSAIIGFVVGATPWLKDLIVGEDAPLKVVQDSLQLLGNGTVPCITLILGGNLTQGLRKSRIKPLVILSIICARYVILPAIGIVVVKAAYGVGFLPHDPLYLYVLMTQFTLPPAMNIGTMAQLLDVGQEECSVIFLWTYLIAAISLTVWSTTFMSILS